MNNNSHTKNIIRETNMTWLFFYESELINKRQEFIHQDITRLNNAQGFAHTKI